MARVYIGIGSNVDPEANIRRGIWLLRRAFGDLIVSPVYESPAVGFAGDNFYNLVVGFDTALDPKALIQALHTIEIQCGRERDALRFSPRTLDLDLLLYGDWVLHEEKLELPRRDILEYAFVLRPLADIAGDLLHPVSGQRIEDLWQRFERNAQPLQPLNPVNLFLETE
jgi:2-amino-4-hydroxy-6-hydroxymethyldihydropteridine diphosphokinase